IGPSRYPAAQSRGLSSLSQKSPVINIKEPFSPISQTLAETFESRLPRRAVLSRLSPSFSALINLETMSFGEVACSYAVMILHDDGIPITAEKISTLVKTANVNVESYWPSLFAKLAEKRNVDDLIMNVGAGGGGAVAVAAPAGGAAAPAAAAPAAEEKKEEAKEESDDDMGFSLFD
ncbi:unnamed protein product, partial [Linum tenue]